MTPEALKSLIAQDEGQHLEFKLIANQKVAATIAAFASAGGGAILVGVEDGTGFIKGITEFEVTSQKCQNLVNAHVAPVPFFTYEQVTVDELKVLVIHVKRGVFPVYAFKNKPLLRVESSNQPMTSDECHLRWRTYEFREGLERLAKVVKENETINNTAAGIVGQSALATMHYGELISRIKGDISDLMEKFREDLETLAIAFENNKPSNNTAAAIFGQSVLATMNYRELIAEIKRDLSKSILAE